MLEPIPYTFTIVFRVIQRQKPGKRKPILSTDSKIRVPKSPWITGTAAGNRIFFIDISTYRDSRLQIHLHTIQMRCHPRRSSRCWSSTSRSFPPSMCTRRSWTRRSWTGSRLRINNNLGWREINMEKATYIFWQTLACFRLFRSLGRAGSLVLVQMVLLLEVEVGKGQGALRETAKGFGWDAWMFEDALEVFELGQAVVEEPRVSAPSPSSSWASQPLCQVACSVLPLTPGLFKDSYYWYTYCLICIKGSTNMHSTVSWIRELG